MRPASASDAEGYIYCFEIRRTCTRVAHRSLLIQPAEPKDKNVVHLKVGRTNKVTRRLDEWNKQCPEEVVPRGVWPAPAGDGAAMLLGTIQPGRTTPYANRLERLIHLELADLVAYMPYLPASEQSDEPQPKARRSNSDDAIVVSSSGKLPSKAKPPTRQRIDCNCGKRHQEIFVFKKPKTGPYKDQVWEKLVRPVIERWGKFVDEHVAP